MLAIFHWLPGRQPEGRMRPRPRENPEADPFVRKWRSLKQMKFRWGLYNFTHFTSFSPGKKWSDDNWALFHPEKSGVIMGPILINWFLGDYLVSSEFSMVCIRFLMFFLFCFQVKLEVGFFNGVVWSREEVIKGLGDKWRGEMSEGFFR